MSRDIVITAEMKQPHKSYFTFPLFPVVFFVQCRYHDMDSCVVMMHLHIVFARNLSNIIPITRSPGTSMAQILENNGNMGSPCLDKALLVCGHKGACCVWQHYP